MTEMHLDPLNVFLVRREATIEGTSVSRKCRTDDRGTTVKSSNVTSDTTLYDMQEEVYHGTRPRHARRCRAGDPANIYQDKAMTCECTALGSSATLSEAPARK